MKKFITHLALAAGLTTTVACTPSINPALNAQHQSRMQAQPSRDVEGTFPVQGMPWQVGQWVTYAMRSDDAVTIATLKLIGKDSTGFWYESENYTPYEGRDNPTIIKVHVSGYRPGDAASIGNLELSQMAAQTGDEAPQSLPTWAASLAGGIAFEVKVTSTDASPQTVRVPGGTFTNAQRVEGDASFGPWSAASTTFMHSAVPIWGYVKLQSDDGEQETVLIDYGYTGATSIMRE